MKAPRFEIPDPETTLVTLDVGENVSGCLDLSNVAPNGDTFKIRLKVTCDLVSVDPEGGITVAVTTDTRIMTDEPDVQYGWVEND